MTISEFVQKTNKGAKTTTHWKEDTSQNEIRAFYRNLRQATCPVTRKAYQLLLNAQTLKRRRDLELRQLIKWASGQEWGWGQHPRFRHSLKMPQTLEGDPDRAHWPRILEEHVGKQFKETCPASQRSSLSLAHLAAQAREYREELKCCPNELRDLALALRPNKAGGEDGIGTNQLRLLPYQAFIYLAKQFEKIANEQGNSSLRPRGWEVAIVVLIAKPPAAKQAAHYRPTALLEQLKKLYARWLLLFLHQD